MISKKEQDCIAEAHKVKLAAAKNRLAELIKKGLFQQHDSSG